MDRDTEKMRYEVRYVDAERTEDKREDKDTEEMGKEIRIRRYREGGIQKRRRKHRKY